MDDIRYTDQFFVLADGSILDARCTSVVNFVCDQALLHTHSGCQSAAQIPVAIGSIQEGCVCNDS